MYFIYLHFISFIKSVFPSRKEVVYCYNFPSVEGQPGTMSNPDNVVDFELLPLS